MPTKCTHTLSEFLPIFGEFKPPKQPPEYQQITQQTLPDKLTKE